MKQFISKVKDLSQKAAELKAAMQQLPPKVAEVREAVAATKGQLQQLKSEIHYSVADLKADNEDHLSAALHEINASEEVFAKAGFALCGVDLEISPAQRILVHLALVEDVHASVLRSLATANQQRRTTHAILSSLLQAKQMAETVEIGGLNYREVIVGVGPVPSVRLCWRPAETELAKEAATQPTGQASLTGITAAAPAASAFNQSTFFEKRTPYPLPQTPVPTTTPQPEATFAAEPSALAAVPQATTAAVSAEERLDPLARWKKMPDLSRPKH